MNPFHAESFVKMGSSISWNCSLVQDRVREVKVKGENGPIARLVAGLL